jgi:hypothetical protein
MISWLTACAASRAPISHSASWAADASFLDVKPSRARHSLITSVRRFAYARDATYRGSMERPHCLAELLPRLIFIAPKTCFFFPLCAFAVSCTRTAEAVTQLGDFLKRWSREVYGVPAG